MKFTLSWLKDHLRTRASLDKIADTLTLIGLEVEAIENPAERLAQFTVAKVLSAEPHPNADKLKVCRVDTGKEVVQVICGAPNARAGMKGVFAPGGAYVPGIDLTLKKAKIRGVESHGMLCSEREMELSDEHSGIIELPAGAPVGKPFAEVMGLDDPVIEIAITPNRPDCLGVRGVARDLAAAGLGRLKPDPVKKVRGEFPCPVEIDLSFPPGAEDACPVFAGRLIRNVTNGPSPDWVQRRLRAIGLRPINALVDITNYISYDRGRPLHVYDADKLTGTIHARLGRKGERFLALDGKEYDVDEEMCVIADDSGVLGLGGIMGGESTGCTEETRNVFIESAYFDPIRTAKTGRKLQLMSDARYRFERGVDPAYVLPGLEQAAAMVLEFCGGIPSDVAMAGKPPVKKTVIAFPGAPEVKRLTGKRVPDTRITNILEKLGFAVKPRETRKGKYLQVTAPSWRPDVHGTADLVEEVVRIMGVDRFPATPMSRTSGVARPVMTPLQRQVRRARRLLAGRGMVEAVTWSFIPETHAKLFGGGQPELILDNPISVDLSTMRPSLLPGLIQAAQRNRDHGEPHGALFEVGPVYAGAAPEDQKENAAGVRWGLSHLTGSGRFWAERASQVDLFDAKADAMALLAALGVRPDQVQITRQVPDWYHPGRAGAIQQGPKRVFGYFGELHPGLLRKLDVEGPLVGFEIALAALTHLRRKSTSRQALEASDLHPVRRDFAFLLDADVPAEKVVQAARKAERNLIEQVSVFDVFAGPSLGEGKKSLGLEVTLQPRDRSLTDEEIEAISNKIIAAVEKATGGQIRR